MQNMGHVMVPFLVSSSDLYGLGDVSKLGVVGVQRAVQGCGSLVWRWVKLPRLIQSNPIFQNLREVMVPLSLASNNIEGPVPSIVVMG